MVVGSITAAGLRPVRSPATRGGRLSPRDVGPPRTALEWVRSERGAEVRGRAYVDTGPILERDLARRAGLGWFGKNAMLINPKKGSFFFIGSLFLDLELTPDAPFTAEHCGSCTAASRSARPTPSRRPVCSTPGAASPYLTIEHRGPIPDEFQHAIGDHLFGCDVCQDVCPWNVRFASAPPLGWSTRPTRRSRHDRCCRTRARAPRPRCDDLSRNGSAASAMSRARSRGLRRNAEIVLRNGGTA